MGGTSQDMDHRVQTVEGPYQYQVGSGGKYDTNRVPGGTPARITDMDHQKPTPKGAGGIKGHWDGGGDMEKYHLHHKHSP